MQLERDRKARAQDFNLRFCIPPSGVQSRNVPLGASQLLLDFTYSPLVLHMGAFCLGETPRLGRCLLMHNFR